MTNEEIIKEIKDTMELNRETKRTTNDVLSKALSALSCKKNIEEESYNQGLNDAWELAKKIIVGKNEGGYLISELIGIFGYIEFDKIVSNFTPQKAIARAEAYEKEQKEQKEIKIGDICRFGDAEVVITLINDKYRYEGFYLTSLDKRLIGHIGLFDPNKLIKTNKNIEIGGDRNE